MSDRLSSDKGKWSPLDFFTYEEEMAMRSVDKVAAVIFLVFFISAMSLAILVLHNRDQAGMDATDDVITIDVSEDCETFEDGSARCVVDGWIWTADAETNPNR